MIIDILILGFKTIITKVIFLISNLFPNSSGLSDDAMSSVTNILSATSSFNFVIPLDTLWAVLVGIVSFEFLLFIGKWALYMIRISTNR